MTRGVGDEEGLEDTQHRGAGVERGEARPAASGPRGIDRRSARSGTASAGSRPAVATARRSPRADVGGRRAVEAQQALEQPGHGIEGRALVVGRALPDLRGADPIAEPLGQRADKAALADAGLARDVDERAATALDLPPCVGEAGELVVAPDDRRQPPPARDLETAHGAGGPQDLVHADGPGDALERLLAERLGLEPAVDELGVASVITTPPGRATACRRAATCGMRPTMSSCERVSPATTIPVCRPIRTWSDASNCSPSLTLSATSSSRTPSAAWTARCASSSWARG